MSEDHLTRTFSVLGPCLIDFLLGLSEAHKTPKKESEIYYDFDEILVGNSVHLYKPATSGNKILEIKPLTAIDWSCCFYKVTGKDCLSNVFLIVFKTECGKVFGAFIRDLYPTEDEIIQKEMIESIKVTFDYLPQVFENLNYILNI